MKTARIFRALALSLPMLLAAGLAAAQSAPLDVEIGYRWIDVSGNEDMYRTQVNERDGILLRSLSFVSGPNPGLSFIDNVRVDASDLGVGPAGVFRMEAGLTGAYAVRLFYRRTEHYSALPEFANPLLDHGVFVSQHRYDRRRNSFGLDFDLLKWGAVTPFASYRFDRLNGPGNTTYTVGQDEFLLSQDLRDTSQEFAVGARFDFGAVVGEVSQGWRKVKESEHNLLSPGAGGGNGSGTVLGVPVSLDELARSTETEVRTPVTNAFVAGNLGERVKLTAAYSRAKAKGDTDEAESLSGQLVSFQLLRYFGGLTETLSSKATNESWRGTGHVDVNIVPGLDLTAGWTRQHSELDSHDLASTLFTDTITFDNTQPGDILKLLASTTSLDRTNTTFDAGLKVSLLGPLTFRLGWSQEKQKLDSTPDPSEIVLYDGQGGSFERKIDRFEVGANFMLHGFTLGADWKHERSDELVLRTDFLDRDRYRLRLGLNLMDRLHFTATGLQVDTKNDTPGILQDGKLRQYGGSFDVTAAEGLVLRVGGDKYKSDNTTLIRRPQDYVVEPSLYTQDGRSWNAGFSWKMGPLGLDASYVDFENEGGFPFDLKRVTGRADYTITKNISVAAEWALDDYREHDVLTLGNYRANRYGLYVRWTQ